jgi:hypothetical protein
MQTSLDDDNPISTPLSMTTFSSTSVCMNSLNSTNKEKDRAKTLVTLHKQVKFLVNCSHKYAPWAVFVINNGNLPNCEEVQQWNYSICFPHVVPMYLIGKKTKGKKGIIAYNTLFGTSAMKKHVEFEHLNS